MSAPAPTGNGILDIYRVFSPKERRNIIIYSLGIMCYKFALEYFNRGFITMANDRFGDQRYKKIGILTGLNSAMQCVGSIVIAPLIKRYPTRSVLSYAVLTFGLISAIVLVVDAATGGKIKFATADNKVKYGNWDPNGLFPIYIISGVAYGMVELIRRVIPRDIVGRDVQKLRRMDATVHILYEVAGTAGAFTSTSLIKKFGYNYSAILSPILFTAASVVWRFVSDVGREQNRKVDTGLAAVERYESSGIFGSVINAFRSFGKAFYLGAIIVFSSRKYVWLVTGYSVALYAHRYLENGLAPIFAKSVIGDASFSQIIVGGSNFGELLGALSVLVSTNKIPTPIPWLRFDAFMLNIVWVMPFLPIVAGSVNSAWKLAAIFIPISFGWAAGDVSLAAYIQSTLAKIESKDPDVSTLGAVMAFLYVTYIVLYAVLSAVLGNWVDAYLKKNKPIVGTVAAAREALKYVGGVQFTVIAVVVLASTLVPRGSWALNPKIIDNNPMTDSDVGSDLEKDSVDDSITKEKELNATAVEAPRV
ncbi:major facilitator superfamily domain-containing protein [Mycena rebaudengoi]|nr:major facilitator superfamily domain-containing protein [Mycena rebaudengoi]